MRLLKNLLERLRGLMVKLKTGKMGAKERRPRVQKIIFIEVIEGEAITTEKWIIVKSNGETLEAPIFSTKKEAEEWLDQYHPSQNYASE